MVQAIREVDADAGLASAVEKSFLSEEKGRAGALRRRGATKTRRLHECWHRRVKYWGRQIVG